jgi:hypothetical protein
MLFLLHSLASRSQRRCHLRLCSISTKRSKSLTLWSQYCIWAFIMSWMSHLWRTVIMLTTLILILFVLDNLSYVIYLMLFFFFLWWKLVLLLLSALRLLFFFIVIITFLFSIEISLSLLFLNLNWCLKSLLLYYLMILLVLYIDGNIFFIWFTRCGSSRLSTIRWLQELLTWWTLQSIRRWYLTPSVHINLVFAFIISGYLIINSLVDWMKILYRIRLFKRNHILKNFNFLILIFIQ